MDSTENLLVADAKAKVTVATSVDYDETVCFGDEANFTFNFPQAYNANNKEQKTLVILELWNELSGEWNEIHQGNYDGAGPQYFSYDLGAEGTYQLQHRIGTGNNWTEISVSVVDCSDCEESFNYLANEDGSYTFTYVPEEDMDEAEVVFTFAQSVVASGYDWPSWKGNSSSRTETMDLKACDVYTWTVFLTGDCSGNSNESNLWTDFNVDGDSKKNDETPNIKKSC